MTGTVYSRATCPECGGYYALTNRGRLRKHRRDFTKATCAGSGQQPTQSANRTTRTQEADMKHETYKGRRIKAVKGHDYGWTRIVLNGVDLGDSTENEDAALKSVKARIDFADEVGVASGRCGIEYYVPGTYEVCEYGHAKPIGGQCGHKWCTEQRARAEQAAPASSATQNDGGKAA
jgi:hypothetical protein